MKIRCGKSHTFQGDERDVIFISLVTCAKEGTPLSKNSDNNPKLIKEYNVAVSRAKKQIWCVHSIDEENHLKSGDIRLKLINHFKNPYKLLNKYEIIKNNSDSPFETEVCLCLKKSGFIFEQQYEIGSYKIDIMFKDKEDRKTALECDGETFHSSKEQIKNDNQRQRVLERLGLKFIRLRGSEYYLNKELAMQRIVKLLDSYGVERNNSVEYVKDISHQSDLTTKVRLYSEELIMKWRDVL